jgi:hypothetical protein
MANMRAARFVGAETNIDGNPPARGRSCYRVGRLVLSADTTRAIRHG